MKQLINYGQLPTDESGAKALLDLVNKMSGEAKEAMSRLDERNMNETLNELQDKINELTVLKAVEPLRTTEVDKQLVKLNKEIAGLNNQSLVSERSIYEYVLNKYKKELKSALALAEKEYQENLKAWQTFHEEFNKQYEAMRKTEKHFLYDADYKLNLRWVNSFLRNVDSNLDTNNL